MARLRMRLLGNFRLSRGTEPVSIPQRKARALLAYLASHPEHACSRAALIGVLWAKTGDKRALTSLRQCLFQLRRRTEHLSREPLVHASGDLVRLDISLVDVDLLRLRALAEAQAETPLADALPLADGDFLCGLHVDEGGFEEWLAGQRLEVQEQRRRLLRQCVAAALATDAMSNAITAARLLVQLDPFDEEAQRVLLRTYVAAGEERSALERYRHLFEMLRRELAVEPHRETAAIVAPLMNVGAVRGSVSRREPSPDVEAHEEAEPIPRRLALPREPSLAVLPFTNWTGRTDCTIVALGLAADLINALSRYRRLFVTSRSSTFSYVSKFVPARQIAAELGVRYVLEGDLRDAGKGVKISWDLVDAVDDRSIWFDEAVIGRAAVGGISKRILESIVTRLSSEIEAAERERALRASAKDLDAWHHFHRGMQHYNTHLLPRYAEAKRHFTRAVELEPAFVPALVGLAKTNLAAASRVYVDSPEPLLKEAEDAIARARALDHRDERAMAAAAQLLMRQTRYAEATELARAAVALNPNWSGAHSTLGQILYCTGRTRDAIRALARAARLGPRAPRIRSIFGTRARAHLALGELEEALYWAELGTKQRVSASPVPRTTLMATLALLGRVGEARELMDDFMVLREGRFSASRWSERRHYLVDAEHRERFAEGLRLAGAPP